MGRFEEERQKAIERVRAKGGDETKVCRTASEFLDGLTDLFCEAFSSQTTEEMRKELQERGIDTDAAVAKVKALVKEKLEAMS